MARILLFDIHSDGHHLEYASTLQTDVRELLPTSTVDVLAPSPEGDYDEYFATEDISYLHDDRYGIEQRLSETPVAVRDELVQDALTYADEWDYDICHFLQIDDIVREVHRHVGERRPDPAIVGWIIGSYFNEESLLNRTVSRLLRSPVGPAVEPLLPEAINDVRRHRNDVYMYRAMRQRSLDHVFVPTERGRAYLGELAPEYVEHNVSVVPDPTELYSEMDVDRASARDRLDLPTDEPVLLFFGGMREEKGIGTLLEGLRRYEGPPFTMLLAGPPQDVTEADLEAVAASAVPDLELVLEYIPETRFPQFFVAADCVVTPYRRSFGRRRPSNVFQKAAGAGRPVIAPAFGMFEDRIQEYGLGVTFDPESPASLAEAMATFVRSDGEIGDPDGIETYARSQTYQVLSAIVTETYQRILEDT